MRRKQNMIFGSRVGLCLLAASLGSPIALADSPVDFPAHLNRINETQKACSGEAATQALEQLRASVVDAGNSGRISKEASQSALSAIDQARSALNSDSLKGISAALVTVGQQVKALEANAAQHASNATQLIVKSFSELKPDEISGKTLYDSAGNQVASVRGVRTAADGRIEAVEIDVGGFFGLGKKQIFVPVNDLQIKDGRIQAVSLTADQIRNLSQTAANEVRERAGEVRQEASNTAQRVENRVAEAKDKVVQGAERLEQKAADAAQTVKDKVANAAERVENRVSGAAQQASDAAQNAKNQAADAAQRATRAWTELKADDVTGKTLYDNAGNAVANVKGVRTGADGRIDAVEIDVGGIFGLGQKRILIPVNDLQFRDGRIHAVSLTSDQIRNLSQTAANEVRERAGEVRQEASDAAQAVKDKVSGAAQQTANAVKGATISLSALKESDVLGSTLYDGRGNSVANVLQVQAAPDGRIEAVIIDVGGFLGLGSKRIVIPVSNLQFRQGRIDAPSLTLEQIHNLPAAAQ